ncbi:MAG: hypothetical protein KDA47_21280 [Planctomycetales bacterium]|nr:hypothetical protein [Planctomycetales bacterium]
MRTGLWLRACLLHACPDLWLRRLHAELLRSQASSRPAASPAQSLLQAELLRASLWLRARLRLRTGLCVELCPSLWLRAGLCSDLRLRALLLRSEVLQASWLVAPPEAQASLMLQASLLRTGLRLRTGLCPGLRLRTELRLQLS